MASRFEVCCDASKTNLRVAGSACSQALADSVGAINVNTAIPLPSVMSRDLIEIRRPLWKELR